MGHRSYLTVVSCLLLVLGTLGLYGRVRANPFVGFDDNLYVTQNPLVQAGLNWRTFAWAWTSTQRSGNWHPLTWLSHALDCQLYGLNPAGHHVTNVLLHVLNVLLLFLLLLRATGAMGRSLLVAALFALHPFNVESVAWIAERKNVLSTLFFLLALGAYGWYAVKPNLRRYLVVAVLFVLGLAAKPMVITLPFVLLLLDFWPLQRTQGWGPATPAGAKRSKSRSKQSKDSAAASVKQASGWRLILEKLPLMALCAASAAITIIAQRSSGSIQDTERIPLDIRLGNAMYSYALYVWKAFWPTRLALYYPYPHNGLGLWRLALAALFLVGVTSLVWRARWQRRYLLTGWLWYLGTLVPVIGLIQVGDQAMADRYAYVPLIGVFVMVVWVAADWAEGRSIHFKWRALAAAAIMAALAFLTWRQVGYWKSDYDLWSHTLEITTDNFVAEAKLASTLRSLGQPQEALIHFQNATRLSPEDPGRYVNMAADLAECGRLQEAIAQYATAINLMPDPKVQARTYESIAALYAALGDYSKVRDSYRQALQLDPRQADAMVAHLSQSIAAQPTGSTYLQLGLLQEQAGHVSEARAAYEKALNLDPSLDYARRSLESMLGSGK